MLASVIFIATWCMVPKCMTVSATTIYHRREVPPNPEVVRELDDDDTDPPPPLLHPSTSSLVAMVR